MAEGELKMEISLEEYGKLSDRITELKLENERLRKIVLATQSWISVKDRLPEEDSRVLAFVENGIMIANYLEGWFYYIENEDGDMCPSDDIEVSYWMPLPEPPEVENDE